jgi:hypothetical protein
VPIRKLWNAIVPKFGDPRDVLNICSRKKGSCDNKYVLKLASFIIPVGKLTVSVQTLSTLFGSAFDALGHIASVMTEENSNFSARKL